MRTGRMANFEKNGLTCALPWGEGLTRSLDKGFCDPANHDELIKGFEDIIPKVQAAGYNQTGLFFRKQKGNERFGWNEKLRGCITKTHAYCRKAQSNNGDGIAEQQNKS